MEWTWVYFAYLLFAFIHPISELVWKTNLRFFLNKDYYQTGREDFPVSIRMGKSGSVFVLAILALPVFWRSDAVWCFALGLAVADVIQHFVHLVWRPGKMAPWVHLITIVGVLYFLWRIAPDPKPDFLAITNLGALLAGALMIVGNWLNNSRLTNRQTPASAHL